jgi:undecaprenyl-diphosphatase
VAEASAGGLITAILLGVVQGLTEFLPVSSSGHLVVFQRWLAVHGDDVLFDLVLHLGTLVPALWFYRADVLAVLRDTLAGVGPWLARPGVRLAAYVAVASVPTAAIGLAFEDTFEALFANPGAVGVAFALTGIWLALTRGREEGRHDLSDLPWTSALLVGLAQGIAITPGISRSGATIGAALLLGLRRDVAVKLSFLMSVPAILGAVVLRIDDAQLEGVEPLHLLAGAVTAGGVGWFALRALVWIVTTGRVAWFSGYLFVMSALTLLGVALGWL